jgi:hypothetical protein
MDQKICPDVGPQYERVARLHSHAAADPQLQPQCRSIQIRACLVVGPEATRVDERGDAS